MYSESLKPDDHATKLRSLHQDQRNWDRVFISKDKFSGSLRYTHEEAEAKVNRFRKLFKGLTSIEIHREQIEGYFVADLISERTVKTIESPRGTGSNGDKKLDIKKLRRTLIA
jgi:hypothetical protein